MQSLPAEKSIVIFGAGKIGRSFIGQLFSSSGYSVIFIDIDQKVINELNRRGEYTIVIKSQQDELLEVTNVSGILAYDKDAVSDAIAESSLMATCVGKNALPKILPLIAQGLEKRYLKYPNYPLDIILAENIRDAHIIVKDGLNILLDKKFPLDQYVGIVETSIGKMVPIMPRELEEDDPLLVFAESYHTLILDKIGFKNEIPNINGLLPKENMKAWVDRKIFIHNLGHATTAYLGHIAYPSATYLYEVLLDNNLAERVRNTMLQAADILLKKYPSEFTKDKLLEHVDDLLRRFRNQALGDTIFRVGCDLQRKLGKDDRLAGAIHLAQQFKLPYELILEAVICGCNFKATDQDGYRLPADIQFDKIYKTDLNNVLREVCGFDESIDKKLFKKAKLLRKIGYNTDNIRNQVVDTSNY